MSMVFITRKKGTSSNGENSHSTAQSCADDYNETKQHCKWLPKIQSAKLTPH